MQPLEQITVPILSYRSKKTKQEIQHENIFMSVINVCVRERAELMVFPAIISILGILRVTKVIA